MTRYYCGGCPAKCECEVEECAKVPNGRHTPNHCLFHDSCYVSWWEKNCEHEWIDARTGRICNKCGVPQVAPEAKA